MGRPRKLNDTQASLLRHYRLVSRYKPTRIISLLSPFLGEQGGGALYKQIDRIFDKSEKENESEKKETSPHEPTVPGTFVLHGTNIRYTSSDGIEHFDPLLVIFERHTGMAFATILRRNDLDEAIKGLYRLFPLTEIGLAKLTPKRIVITTTVKNGWTTKTGKFAKEVEVTTFNHKPLGDVLKEIREKLREWHRGVEISCERATSLKDEAIVVPGEWTRDSLNKELESWLEKYNYQKRTISRKGQEAIVTPIAILHETLREKQLRSRKRPPDAPQLIDPEHRPEALRQPKS